MFRAAMSIFARRTCAPSGNSPALILAKRSLFSSTVRFRCGLSAPGSVIVPRPFRISSSLWLSTYAFPSRTRRIANSYSVS